MMVLAQVIVTGVASGLIGGGAYFHYHRRRFNVDPALIAGCYLLGGFYLAAFLV